MRIRAGLARARRKRRLRKDARGAYGARSKRLRATKENLMRAMRYAQHDRRLRKRDFRRLWIERINAASRERGITYSQLISGLSRAGVLTKVGGREGGIDRNMLANLAVVDAGAFDRLVEIAKAQFAPAKV